MEDSLTGGSRCRRQGSASAFPKSSQHGRDRCPSQGMLVLHRAAPLPSSGILCLWYFLTPIKSHPPPSPRRLTSRPRAIFLPLLQFLPPRMPMFHCGGTCGGCPSLPPMKIPFSLLLCGQNATLWGRILQCLQLVECSSARLVPSRSQWMFPMNVTLL